MGHLRYKNGIRKEIGILKTTFVKIFLNAEIDI